MLVQARFNVRRPAFLSLLLLIAVLSSATLTLGGEPSQATPPAAGETGKQDSLKSLLDAPMLFVKRHAYFAGHIYDDYITWRPGGGIYILENPWEPPEKHRIRAVIDPTTNETLGEGVYRDAELSWDAKRVLFAFKGTQDGHTCIYEIGLDGQGLRRLTNPDEDCACPPQEDRTGRGHHDITPAYLPDGRIVFTSTRPRALVPCFNSGVDTLHVMDGDGGNIHSISVNNVNEFDPAVLHDGRILFGRWEYVDKTALYMQSLWTIAPDGRMEEALFANNLAKPTAILDARSVPGSHLIAACLTPHNGQAVGAIVTIDPHKGKNDLDAITNFTPEFPTEMDQGLKRGPCDPWPLSEEVMLISNNAEDHAKIQIIHRDGRRELVYVDPEISCYSPTLIKPRANPPVVPPSCGPEQTGRFLVTDIYRGMPGVERGAVKRLRIVEETARTSGLPPGGRWWNQAFLVSWQGAYVVKNILGTVPVHEDGSAYFEAPAGRALYFEALDEQNREIQRMRSFVKATPGVTRSCIGCHEHKYSAPVRPDDLPLAMTAGPAVPEPESWGSGFVDYATMVQPIFDRRCVGCHGGEQDIAKGIDLSGGWTWAFNISYETLLKNCLSGFLNCHNSSVHTSELLPPRSIGSGGAPLAELLLAGHEGQIKEMSRQEIDLVLAWMDTNSNYYGSWDYTPHATANALLNVVGPLTAVMQQAGCTQCHASGHIGNDWVNLERPEWSRILRAPMAKSDGGLGLAMCRNRQARAGYPLVTQRVQPPDMVVPSRQPEWDDSGEVNVSLLPIDDSHYREMLEIIRRIRAEVLAQPRVDMPGAEIVGGECRMQILPPLPLTSPQPSAAAAADGTVQLSWPRTTESIGFQYELHRGDSLQFSLDESTYLGLTTAGRYIDAAASPGKRVYAVVITKDTQKGIPSYVAVDVPQPQPPETPDGLAAKPAPGEVELTWSASLRPNVRYHVFRGRAGDETIQQLTEEPIASATFFDLSVESGTEYVYTVRSVDRRGQVSDASPAATAVPLPLVRDPVFAASMTKDATGQLLDGRMVKGQLRGNARVVDGVLTLGEGGYVTFGHQTEFDIRHALTIECWVRIDEPAKMPVVMACGEFNRSGWFLQNYGGRWRWHIGGVSCDGGKSVVGDWVHLVGTFDGRRAWLYQNGRPVADVPCVPNRAPWTGPLCVGQYSRAAQDYQVKGLISGVKIYQRALPAEEVASSSKDLPRMIGGD